MFSGLVRYIKEHLVPLLSFLEPAIDYLAKNGGIILTGAAETAVAAIAADPSVITDEEKRSKAFQMILDQMKAQGIAAGTSAINLALEAAVARLKAPASGS